MSNRTAILIMALLLTVCITIATWLEPDAPKWTGADKRGQDLLSLTIGDARQLFANHFFTKADVYFHSGYYPSIFDQARAEAAKGKHMAGESDGEAEHEHEQAMNFLGKPKDWIDAFGRNFYPSTHSHLDKPGEAREILPWLRISADLDPHQIETYTVAAYWLRKSLHKSREAEQFLREGLRANPNSYELLFNLGQIYYEDRKDPARARNLWELALRRWNDQSAARLNPEPPACDAILANLANLEEKEGRLPQAINYLEEELKYAPSPDIIDKRIAELKAKLPEKKD